MFVEIEMECIIFFKTHKLKLVAINQKKYKQQQQQ